MTDETIQLGDWCAGAVMSEDSKYRFKLWRRWEAQMGFVCWIMLNPSTADHLQDDATIRRCISFTRRWGYGGMEVVNLFAYRATDPKVLLRVVGNVTGPHNDAWIKTTVESATMTLAAWGSWGCLHGRSKQLYTLLSQHHVMCLGKTVDGEPKHPVRLGYNTQLEPYISKEACCTALSRRISHGESATDTYFGS
jgi:hypothetical protein